MFYLAAKTLITAALVVLVSEVSKRSPLLAGLFASLPLVSVLAILWLYVDTGSAQQVSDLSRGVLLMILPSLLFFICLPLLLKLGAPFAVAMLGAVAITAGGYWAYVQILARFGITL